MIPVEAIEAAVKAVWYGGTAPGCGYGDIPAAAKSTLEKDVREILEAAAPYIRAQALEDAPAKRRNLFRGVDVLLKSGAGNIWRPFPYADDEILDGSVSDRTTDE